MIKLPWWVWSSISVAGSVGIAWVSTRLKKKGLPAECVNLYLFATGTVVFLLYSVVKGSNLEIPVEHRWLFLPLAIFLFVYNFSIVSAYGLADNAGFVKAIVSLEIVILTLVITVEANILNNPVYLPWWKYLGAVLCFCGAVLVAYPTER